MDQHGSGSPDEGPAAVPGGPYRRSPLRITLAVAMVLAGIVWIGQGLGILTAGRSFMIGDPTWAVIGAAFVVLGVVVAWKAPRV
jgi:hypothetical protein